MSYRLVWCIAALLIACTVSALDTELVSTEVTVSLTPQGKAEIYYQLEWNVTSGTMSGFYFEGESFNPVWNMERCFADFPDNTRIPLSIAKVGSNKYDVILANGKRFSGKAIYFLNYAGDFGKTGLVGLTTADTEEYFYFNWAPVEWEYNQQYQAVRLILPVRVTGAELSEEEKKAIPMLTEQFVNKQNSIDYYGTKGNDGYYLTILFYKKNHAAYEKQHIQIYFPKDYIPMQYEYLQKQNSISDKSSSKANQNTEETENFNTSISDESQNAFEYFRHRPLLFIAVFGTLILVSMLAYIKKSKKY